MGGNGWWPLAFLHHFWSLQLCWLKNPDLPGRCNQRLAQPIPAPGSFVASMWFQVPKTRCKRKLRRLWASLTLDVLCGVCGLRPSYRQKGLWFSKSMMDRDLYACSSWHRHRSCAFSLKHLSEGQGTKEQPEKLSVSARSWSQLPTPPELPCMGSARCCDSWYPCSSLTGRVKPPKEAFQAKRATQVLSYEQLSSLCRRFKSHNRWVYKEGHRRAFVTVAQKGRWILVSHSPRLTTVEFSRISMDSVAHCPKVPKYSQRLKGSESPPRERRRVSPRPAPQKANCGSFCCSFLAVFEVVLERW